VGVVANNCVLLYDSVPESDVRPYTPSTVNKAWPYDIAGSTSASNLMTNVFQANNIDTSLFGGGTLRYAALYLTGTVAVGGPYVTLSVSSGAVPILSVLDGTPGLGGLGWSYSRASDGSVVTFTNTTTVPGDPPGSIVVLLLPNTAATAFPTGGNAIQFVSTDTQYVGVAAVGMSTTNICTVQAVASCALSTSYTLQFVGGGYDRYAFIDDTTGVAADLSVTSNGSYVGAGVAWSGQATGTTQRGFSARIEPSNPITTALLPFSVLFWNKITAGNFSGANVQCGYVTPVPPGSELPTGMNYVLDTSALDSTYYTCSMWQGNNIAFYTGSSPSPSYLPLLSVVGYGMTLSFVTPGGSQGSGDALGFAGMGFAAAGAAPLCLTGDTMLRLETGAAVRVSSLTTSPLHFLRGVSIETGERMLVAARVVRLKPAHANANTVQIVYKPHPDIGASANHLLMRLQDDWPVDAACSRGGESCPACNQEVQVPGMKGFVMSHLSGAGAAARMVGASHQWYHIVPALGTAPALVELSDGYFSEMLRCTDDAYLAAAGWTLDE
jgi:hypothetical protein